MEVDMRNTLVSGEGRLAALAVIALAVVLAITVLVWRQKQIRVQRVQSDLEVAVRNGDAAKVKDCLTRGADPGKYDPEFGGTPLHLAAMRGHVDVAELLLGAGADINAVGHSGRTALSISVWCGKTDMVRFLLEHGANQTIHTVAALGNVEMLRGFLNGEEVDLPDSRGRTPALWAINSGNTSTLKELLGAGANVEARDPMGSTLLHLSAYRGDNESTRLLLEAGANPNSRDRGTFLMETPLDMAIRAGHDATISLLREYGAKTAEEIDKALDESG